MTDVIETLPEVAPDIVTLVPSTDGESNSEGIDSMEVVGFVQDQPDEEVVDLETVI